MLGGVLTAVLVLATVASLLAAGYFNQAAQSERAARHEAELSRQAESSQRQRAELEKKRADVTLADMYTSRGLLAGERDAPAEAVLWFAAAADQSATAEDSRRQEDNRLRARNWMRQATLPVAAMSLSGDARQLDFQPRGDLLLVRSGKGEVIFWSWRDGKRLPWAEKLAGVGSAQFSPDGASVALGFLSGEVQIRNVTDGELLAKIQHQGQIKALAFSPDGKFLAIASHSRAGLGYQRASVSRAGLEPSAAGQRPRVQPERRSPDHDVRRQAGAGVRRGERAGSQGAPVRACGACCGFATRADRRRPHSGHGQRRIRAHALGHGDRQACFEHRSIPRPWDLQGVVASPDGNWFATGGYYGPELYAADAKQPPVYLGHTNMVKRFVFSPDSTMLLSVSWDQTARLWSLPHGQPLGPPLKHMANVEQCAWSHDARYLATAQNDGLIRVWQRPVDDLVIAKEPGWGQRPRVSFDGRLVVPGLWHESPFGGDGHQNVNRLRVVATANGQPGGSGHFPARRFGRFLRVWRQSRRGGRLVTRREGAARRLGRGYGTRAV